MKAVFTMVICLISINYSIGQGRLKDTGKEFPDSESEFVVTFPDKPNVRTLYGKERSGLQAELLLQGLSFVRAESNRMSPAEMTNIKEMDNEAISKIPLKYATNIGLSDPVVSVETNDLGKYAKLRGYTKVGSTTISYEVYIYFGEKDIISLYAAAPSTEFPPLAILKFFNSLRRRNVQN